MLMICSKGDQALFRLNTATLKRKMKVPANRPLADFLPTISIINDYVLREERKSHRLSDANSFSARALTF